MAASKYRGGTGHGHSRTLDRHPRVLEYDDASTDDGVRIVTLVHGFAFDDPARNPGDDPETRMALHSKAFRTVGLALEQLRWAEFCHCGRCTGVR